MKKPTDWKFVSSAKKKGKFMAPSPTGATQVAPVVGGLGETNIPVAEADAVVQAANLAATLQTPGPALTGDIPAVLSSIQPRRYPRPTYGVVPTGVPDIRPVTLRPTRGPSLNSYGPRRV